MVNHPVINILIVPESKIRSLLAGNQMSQLMRLWYLPHTRPANAEASLRIRAVMPEPSLFAHIKYGRRRVRLRYLALLDGCACAFEDKFMEDEKYHNLITWLKLPHVRNLPRNRLVFFFSITDTNEPRHDKTNKMRVRPAKTHISLGIRFFAVRSMVS